MTPGSCVMAALLVLLLSVPAWSDDAPTAEEAVEGEQVTV